MVVLTISFEDFEKLVRNHRVYYYESDDYIDLHFLFDGTIIKTTVLKMFLENPEQFFSQKMFYGAVRLKFRIPDNKETNVELVDIRLDPELIDIQEIQDEEIKQPDIQREGVE